MLTDGTPASIRRLGRDDAADCVRRVGRLVDALPEMAEIEVNPLVVTPVGAVALDVRVRIRPEA